MTASSHINIHLYHTFDWVILRPQTVKKYSWIKTSKDKKNNIKKTKQTTPQLVQTKTYSLAHDKRAPTQIAQM